MNLNNKNKNVYCPVPWREQMIDSNGAIKLCCSARQAIRNDDGTESNINTNTLDEVWNNQHMQKIRHDMLNGKKPDNEMCENCYTDERFGSNSSRINELQNYGNTWSQDILVKEYPDNIIVEHLPEYYDLRFGNLCNLQCIMCDPHYSSRLMTEQDKVIQVLQTDPKFANSRLLPWYQSIRKQFGKKDSKMYAWPSVEEIFNSITCRLSESNCTQLYVNGGEPTLYNKKMSELLQKLIVTGQAKNIELWLNTNATIVDIEFYKLLSNFKKIRLMLSIDGIEESFEYIRYPAKWSIVDNNIKKIVDYIHSLNGADKWNIDFQPTFQVLNLLDIDKMIDYWLEIKNKQPCTFTISKLTNPPWFDVINASRNVRYDVNSKIQKSYNTSDYDVLRVTNVLNNILTNTSEENQDNLINELILLHEVHKQTRKIDHLDAWFYDTIKKLF